jgi:hypothetical protein
MRFFQIKICLLKLRLSRCESMLNRTNRSERIIEKHNQLCLQLQNEIDILQEKLSKLDEDFKVKKKNFSTVSLFNEYQIFQINKTLKHRLSKIVEKKKNYCMK